MKKFASRTVIALVMFAMTSVMAFAGDKNDQVKFNSDVYVNGKLVKKGTYNVKFNEHSNEVTILDGSSEVAKSPARLDNRERKANRTEAIFSKKDNVSVLRGITLEGDDQAIIINGAQAATPQQ